MSACCCGKVFIECDKINHIAVENIAKVAKTIGAKVIHISTDYVFDGKSNKPYNEDDATAPQLVYGTTKLNGENALKEIIPDDFIIIRTAWCPLQSYLLCTHQRDLPA